MTRSPDLYMIVRATWNQPGGVEYYAADGGYNGPVSKREHAKLYGVADARTIARALNLVCASGVVRGEWQAVPAEINVPSPYQPQAKGTDERRSAAEAALEAADREELEHLHSAVEGLEQPAPLWRGSRPMGW